MAQTNPTPQALPYTQDFSSLKGTTLGDTLGTVLSSYPVGWIGWAVANATPSSAGRTTAPASDKLLRVGDAARGTSGCYDYEGKIGFVGANATAGDVTLCLSIITTGSSNIKVTFDAMTMRCLWDGTALQNRKNGLVLQYRVGETGVFTPITYLPAEYNTGTTANLTGVVGINPVTGLNAILPAACDNQPIVQIRWIYRTMDGTGAAGSRPSVALDNISVKKDEAISNNADLVSLSVDEKANSSFVPLMMFGATNYVYDYYLVKGNPIPVIAGELSSGVAVKTVTQATSLTGTDAEKTAKIEVTAQDGTTKKTYSVKFIETENAFLSGVSTANVNNAPVGWSASSMYFASSKIDGNNKYEGLNYARCLSSSTSSSLRLPLTKSVGTLRFYAKKLDAQVVGNIKVSTKIDAGAWTTVQDLGDISNLTYQEFSAIVNQTAVDSMFVRIEITKNGDTFASAGYYLDDISYTASAPTAVFNPHSVTKIDVLKDGITIHGATNQMLMVASLTGQTIISKKVYSDAETVYLPTGFYMMRVGNERYKIRIIKN
ncbi:MAG: DUF6383 domain-containing protein [Bacteroidia bacterium]|nr:DUF6383 domain-containing protein [Bacteroidia bacterium]